MGFGATTARHPFTSLFSSPPWIDALARTYDLRFSASARIQNGVVAAAILFCHVQDVRGERVVCLPFSDYCDPLVEEMADWEDLVEPILALGRPVSLRCLSSSISPEMTASRGLGAPRGTASTLPDRRMSCGRDCRRRPARTCARPSAAASIRRGKTLEDIRLFHQMHRQVRKSKYCLLAQPLAFFENLYQAFAAIGGIIALLAEFDGRPIAGIFLLAWGDILYYKFNASIDLKCRPNDLLMWYSILLGRALGMKRLDFGISDIDQPGLVRYKRKFATEEREDTDAAVATA